MAENEEHDITSTSNSQFGPPHECLFLVLAYLPVFELLATSQVCRSLKDAVENDILPWLNIIVDKPLNKRLSDDILMKIISRSNGRLRTLALINCLRITDDVLQLIATKNPYIEKLFVPGCTTLTPNGVIKTAKILPKLKSIKINGIYNVTKDDLQILHSLVNNHPTQPKLTKNMYHNYRNSSTNPSPIDVEICPKCTEIRMVFDCPRDSCRGCYLCILRCDECGICVKIDDEVGDAACEDTLCLNCWLKLPKCSFCNKAYCRTHDDQKIDYTGPSEYLCVACHLNLTENFGFLKM